MLVPGGDSLTKESQKPEMSSSDELAIAFLRAWEAELSDDFPFSQEEIKVIKCNLYGVVTERYSKTGEMSFTDKELKQAIEAARELVKPANHSRKSAQSVNQLCFNFVGLFLDKWKDRANFTEEEHSVIFAHLYASTVLRYEASHCSTLKFTKRELKAAKDFVLRHRSKQEREAKADERDRRIRALRARLGSAVESRVIIHD